MQEFFQDRRNQAMFGGTVLFMFIFPIYFALVPSLVGLDDAGLSDSSGTWEVSFTEETFTQTENSGELGDGEPYDSIFTLTEDMIGANRNVASVTVEVSCNDDVIGANDGASGESDLAAVSGNIEDQSASGDCGGGNAFSVTWNIVDSYDGQTYETEGKMSEITSQWSDNESARGEWFFSITAEVNEGFCFSGLEPTCDDVEDYDITWTAVVFELSMEPVLNIDDPTTE